MDGMTVQATAADTRDHPAVSWAARVGFAAYGAVYVAIAWLAAQVALGDPTDVSKNGALHQLADQPLGRSVLWVAAGGLAALVVWELCQAVGGHRDKEGLGRWALRAASLFRCGVFGSLAFSAAKVAMGSDSSGGSGQDYTATVLDLPFGPLLVGGVGVGVIVYALVSGYKGLSDTWRKELDLGGRTGHIGRALAFLARAGYVSRGVAFALVGGMLVWAALDHDPSKGAGLDVALGQLREAPYGPFLLLAVAVGLACYGVFNIAKLRHLRHA